MGIHAWVGDADDKEDDAWQGGTHGENKGRDRKSQISVLPATFPLTTGTTHLSSF
jgi:hypothetical protein